MTASSHAVGFPVAVLPGRRRAAVRTPIPRQLRARRLMLSVAAMCAAITVVGTAQQIAAHGWRDFVFRAPGVGGSPDAEEPLPSRPVAGPPAPSVQAPTDPHRHRRPAVHHHHERPGITRSSYAAAAPVASPRRITTSRPDAEPSRHEPTHRPKPTTGFGSTTGEPTGPGDGDDDPVTTPPDSDDPPSADVPAPTSAEPPATGGVQPPPPRREPPPRRPGPRSPQRGPAGPPATR